MQKETDTEKTIYYDFMRFGDFIKELDSRLHSKTNYLVAILKSLFFIAAFCKLNLAVHFVRLSILSIHVFA
jgi:hypothetical protein